VEDTAFYQAALALSLGMAMQAVAARFAIPSIVLLLLSGVAVGPDGLDLLRPEVFGDARADLVTLAVTVILFEGGLGLRVEELRRQQRSLILLLTLGAVISMVGGTWAAYALLDMPLSNAALYGALMIVTGPTVVTPLLMRLSVDRTVRQLLISEGVLNDPIGAIVALVTVEYVVGRSEAWQAGWLVFTRLATGAAIGTAAALALSFVLRREWIPEGLRNPTVLGLVLLVAGYASRVSSEAGLMSAVVQGVVMANVGLRELGRLRQFKEELTVLLLSFIFVLLAANLPLQAVQSLGWNAAFVVFVLIWVVRPLAVFACTAGSSLSFRQKLFVSWICPRGIVAASVAGLFSILLEHAGLPGGEQLEALVFVTVALTVTLQGLTAGPIARLLAVDLPSYQGTIIVGADSFGRLLARLLLGRGRQVVLMDLNAQHCRLAHAAGFPVYEGDALSVETLEDAGARYADTLIAVTTNRELNTLIVQRVRDNFRIERVLGMGDGPIVHADRLPFPGAYMGADQINLHLRSGRALLVEYEVAAGRWIGKSLGELPYADDEFALFLTRRDQVYVATRAESLLLGDRLLCFKAGDGQSPLATELQKVDERPAKTSA
jgi:NhaP-type Na+/H+ or K+/H+ antiporter